MRQEIYRTIRERLAAIHGGAIRHIDLWNRNVEFIEQETPWERPAVFVEFHPIRWNPIVAGAEYRADVEVSLHVVTEWTADPAGLEAFTLLDAIHRALAGLNGDNFLDFDLARSTTNHNHEELVEHVETFRCIGVKSL